MSPSPNWTRKMVEHVNTCLWRIRSVRKYRAKGAVTMTREPVTLIGDPPRSLHPELHMNFTAVLPLNRTRI
jgi:hypothetical protein